MMFLIAATALLATAEPVPELPRPAQPPRIRAGWISNRDYPGAAVRARAEGTVSVRFRVEPNGRVSACEVFRSSGNRHLDAISCRIPVKRFRYYPARDATGQAVATTQTQHFQWNLPSRPSKR